MDSFIDDKKEKNLAKLREIRRIRELNDIRKVLSSPEGRRFYWRVMARAGAFHSSYTGDNNATNFNCGRQDIGYFLLDELLEAEPTTLAQMQREAKSKATREETEDNKE